MEKIVIVGGGISGLSCMNALLDKGIYPLLLEASTIATPKICGEFLAPDAVSLLRRWEISDILPIHQISFFIKEKSFTLDLPQPAGSIARQNVELQLAAYSKKNGGRIQENSLIKTITPPTNITPYIFQLASGEEIRSETAIFATGKYGQPENPAPLLPYVGIKIHFSDIIVPHTLLMHSVKNAYYGIVPISENKSNLACLIKCEEVEKIGSPKQYFLHLIQQSKFLPKTFKQIDLNSVDFLAGKAPEFQLKSIPNWPQAYWIGDAIATLYPAIGSGFSHGIHSAIVAAEHYVKNTPTDYQKISQRYLRPKLILGKTIHNLLFTPTLASLTFYTLRILPFLIQTLLKKLGYNKTAANTKH